MMGEPETLSGDTGDTKHAIKKNNTEIDGAKNQHQGNKNKSNIFPKKQKLKVPRTPKFEVKCK